MKGANIMKDFKRVKPYDAREFEESPWKFEMNPFRCAPHVWYISGQKYVSSFLIDTGDGLAIIDTGENVSLYLLIEAIWEAGFNPKDIKKIFISHGHIDHYGGAFCLKELTEAKLYMSKEDWKFIHNEKFVKTTANIFKWPDVTFEVDEFYDYDKPIKMGNMSFKTKLCPGHTPGTVSFFFDDKDENGQVYKIGMHGGVGTGMITHKMLDMFGLPYSLREDFIDGCRAMLDYDIDISLASHSNQTNFFSGINEKDRNDFSQFVDKEVWKMLMVERIDAMKHEP